jgi:hypothetical protein
MNVTQFVYNGIRYSALVNMVMNLLFIIEGAIFSSWADIGFLRKNLLRYVVELIISLVKGDVEIQPNNN